MFAGAGVADCGALEGREGIIGTGTEDVAFGEMYTDELAGDVESAPAPRFVVVICVAFDKGGTPAAFDAGNC